MDTAVYLKNPKKKNQPLHIIFLFSIVAIIKYNLQIIVLLQNIFPDIPKLYLEYFRHV